MKDEYDISINDLSGALALLLISNCLQNTRASKR